MDDAELVGGVLVGFTDPRLVAEQLARLLRSSGHASAEARSLGLDPELVEALRRRFAATPERIGQACAEGAAWAAGRASIPQSGAWDVVATVPWSERPPGLRRTTTETLVRLVTNASRRVRLAAPFIDEVGLGYLTDSLLAASLRRVDVELLIPTRSTGAPAAIGRLVAAMKVSGDPERLALRTLKHDGPWSHLKVLTADSISAYIGSANFTGPALGGANLELGVLATGPGVEIVDHLLDEQLTEVRPASTSANPGEG